MRSSHLDALDDLDAEQAEEYGHAHAERRRRKRAGKAYEAPSWTYGTGELPVEMPAGYDVPDAPLARGSKRTNDQESCSALCLTGHENAGDELRDSDSRSKARMHAAAYEG